MNTFYKYFFALIIAHLPLSGSDNINKLEKGNQRYINGETECYTASMVDRGQLAKSQTPFAIILTCSDSRIPPEIVFDQRPGDLFIVRIAGNVVDQLGLASIEYGVSVLKVPVLMILGHENCGAVKAAFELGKTEFSTNIASLLSQISPSTRAVKQQHPEKSADELLKLAITQNVLHTHQEIVNRSPVIREHLRNGSLEIVDGVFNIETGKVTLIHEKSH